MEIKKWISDVRDSFSVRFVLYKPNWKSIVKFVLSTIVALFGAIFSYGMLKEVAVWFVLMYIVSLFEIRTDRFGKIISELYLLLISSIFSSYFVQAINILGCEGFEHWNSLAHYSIVNEIQFRLWYPLLITASLYLLVRSFVHSPRIAAAVTPFPFLFLGLADHLLFQARSQELSFADVRAAQTAFTVVGNYNFSFYKAIFMLLLPYIAYIIMVLGFKQARSPMAYVKQMAIWLVLAIPTSVMTYVHMSKISEVRNVNTYRNLMSDELGYLSSFVISYFDCRFDAPEGYVDNYISDRLSELVSNGSNEVARFEDDVTIDRQPNVVVIMNESYTDMTIFDNMGLADDPTPFLHELMADEDVISGYAMSSVYGGLTANSEFELLTSLTTAFIPNGTIAYNFYVYDELYSLATLFDELGYRTVAIHPYFRANWSRSRVYDLLGFEETYFIEDMSYDEDDLIREYLSDEYAYSLIQDELTSDEDGERTFQFMITMQNHGGYTDYYDNFEVEQYVTDGPVNSIQMDIFLNLMRESDRAIEEFLTWLEDFEEPTVVLVFGDHHPHIPLTSNSSYEELYDTMLDYTVPYFIWTNYETYAEPAEIHSNLTLPEDRNTVLADTSISYLGLYILELIGVDEPAYYEIIRGIYENVPVLSPIGFYSNDEQAFVGMPDRIHPQYERENDSLSEYTYLVYEMLN